MSRIVYTSMQNHYLGLIRYKDAALLVYGFTLHKHDDFKTIVFYTFKLHTYIDGPRL